MTGTRRAAVMATGTADTTATRRTRGTSERVCMRVAPRRSFLARVASGWSPRFVAGGVRPLAAHCQRSILGDRRRQHLERVHAREDRKSTRLNSSHGYISYAVFCLKKKKKIHQDIDDLDLRLLIVL